MMEETAKYAYFCNCKECKTIVVRTPKDKKYFKLELPYETDYDVAISQIKKEIYLTGGGKGSTYLKTTMKFIMNIVNDPEKEELPNMTIARASHSMTSINEKFLFVVGGLNFSSIISSCERFDIEKCIWTPIASLNESRMQVSLIAIEPKSLYAFGGVINTGSNATNTIEYLNTEDESSKLWTIIKLNSGADIWPKIKFAGTLVDLFHMDMLLPLES